MFQCLFENKKIPRGRYGLEYKFRMSSKSEFDVEINFGKAVIALGLTKALDETNMIVYRGFWANAKKCEVACPEGLFDGIDASPTYVPDPEPENPDLNGNYLLWFRGRTMQV